MQCLSVVAIALVMGFVAAIPMDKDLPQSRQQMSDENIINLIPAGQMSKGSVITCAIDAVKKITACFKKEKVKEPMPSEHDGISSEEHMLSKKEQWSSSEENLSSSEEQWSSSEENLSSSEEQWSSSEENLSSSEEQWSSSEENLSSSEEQWSSSEEDCSSSEEHWLSSEEEDYASVAFPVKCVTTALIDFAKCACK